MGDPEKKQGSFPFGELPCFGAISKTTKARTPTPDSVCVSFRGFFWNPRPQPASKASLILLDSNPFTTVKYGGATYVNVYSQDHQRSAGDVVRFRGPPEVISAGPGGADEADLKNLQAFGNIPTFDNVSDLNNTSGFTIALGQIDSGGNVTGATTTDALTTPINYFYITSTSTATTGNIKGGGANCSAGPVTLGVVNG